MKVKDAFIYHAMALNQLIVERKLALYEAQFELGEPGISEDRKKILLDRIDRLSCSIGGYQMMMDMGETHETNF